MVKPTADGVNTLEWMPNGNRHGTQYLIEAKVGDAGPWVLTAVTTKAIYAHAGQTPGQKVYYRVKAQRDDQSSQYSNDAVAYGP